MGGKMTSLWSVVTQTPVLLFVASLLFHLSSATAPGPTAYTAPGAFPTSLYASYYNDPTATSVEPQPVVSDPVTVRLHTTPWMFTQCLL